MNNAKKIVKHSKKTDEPLLTSIHTGKIDELVEIKFTWLDYLRILIGLILLSCILSKLLLGEWSPINLSTSKDIAKSLAIPDYWQNKYDEFPIVFALADLKEYSGINENDRILLSIKGHVFDVTRSSRFYGKWGAYQKFTGTDCCNIFSYPQWDISALSKECDSNIENFTETQLKRLDSWYDFFKKNYPEIGYVKELN